MLKRLLFLLLPIAANAQSKVDYKICYSENLEKEGLKVQVTCKLKEAADSTCFHFSEEVWGEKDLSRSLRFTDKDNPGKRFKLIPETNTIVVYHPLSKELSFCYHVKQDHEDDVKTLCRPKIKNNYFHILGHSLFAVPEQIFDDGARDPDIQVNIEWLGFPESFRIHNTFGTGNKKQTLKVKLWTELYHSLFAGGDYRIYYFYHEKKPVYFAIRGEWLNGYTDAQLFEKVKRTINTQRDFWKDNDFDYYTVILTPSVTQTDSLFRGQSMKGSGVKNGFLIQSTNNPFNSYGLISQIINHEMMHDWIGGKIRMKNEELNFWFSEGFTDYYAYKNRLRTNDLSQEQWLDLFNKDVFAAHWNNPEKNLPNYILRDDFWKSRNIEKIPYRRGAVFAFWLDNKILKKSNYEKSLDDLMRELLNECVREKKEFTDELFMEIAEKYTGEDIHYFFQKHVISGVDIEFSNSDLINEFKMEYSEKTPKLNVANDLLNKYIL
jgi:predicted metalloprotease with PDZ domain